MTSVNRVGILVLTMTTMVAAPLRAQSSDPSPSPLAGRDLSRFLPRQSFEDDGHRTLGAFGKNLGRNFAGVFAKDNLAPLLIGASVSGGGSFLDGRFREQFGSAPQGSFAKSGGLAGGAPVILPAVAGLFVAGRFSPSGPFRSATYDMAQALIVNSAYTYALKRTVGRTRPDGSDNQSFPSGHASDAFALATVVNAHFGPKAGIPAYLAAGAVGFSRVSKNVHNLSDVLAGATLGYIVGRTVVREDGQALRKKTHFQLVPAAPPTGTGVGAGVSIDW